MRWIDFDRITRAVFLDRKVYSEIAEDKDALVQAIIVVLLATIIGDIWLIIFGSGVYLILIPILVLPAWVIGVGILHIIAKLLGGKADFVSYLKAIGFAEAPMALGVIPFIGWFIGAIWNLACCVIATKVVHRLSTGKAILVILFPFILVILMVLIVLMYHFL